MVIRAYSCIANLLGQQFIHLGHGQRLELKTGFLDLPEELVNRPTVVRDRSRRQPTFPCHLVGELGDVIGVRLLDGGRWLQPPQESQPPNGMAGEPYPPSDGFRLLAAWVDD